MALYYFGKWILLGIQVRRLVCRSIWKVKGWSVKTLEVYEHFCQSLDGVVVNHDHLLYGMFYTMRTLDDPIHQEVTGGGRLELSLV